MTRRLLMTTYGFPPVTGVAIERTLRHVAYLPEHGWLPVVVAPAHPGYRLVDVRANERIPGGTEVHRVYAPEPAHLRSALRHLTGSLRAQTATGPGDGGAPTPGSSPAPAPRAGASASRWLNEAWSRAVPLLFFPDEQVLWAPAAAIVGLSTHLRTPVDAIYSSSPPVSSHLAAALVHSFTGLPWVADFRDPWIGNAFAPPVPAIHHRIRRDLERLIVHAADRTVFATATLRGAYARRYPDLEGRFVGITNGYDLAELRAVAPTGPDHVEATFRLVYAGAVYGDRELTIFLDGLDRLLATHPELRDRLRVEFIGSMNPANQRIATSRFPALAPVVARRPQLSRDEALREVAAADAGLVLMADGPGREVIATGKLFDYIGLDRPILAVAPPGEARRILDELAWGIAVDPTADGVARGLEQLLSTERQGRTADPSRRYERRQLTAKLAAILDEVVPG